MTPESTSSSGGSRVRLIRSDTTPHPGDPRAGLPPIPADPALPRSNPAFLQEVLAVLTGIAMLLSARLLLLLAATGAFVITYLAVQSPETGRLLASLIYDLCVLGPLVYLFIVKG